MERICYRRLPDYKYELVDEPCVYETGWQLDRAYAVAGDWVTLAADGRLVIKVGYAWDGASGPAVDTPSFMRGSLVHDALYQLMRDAGLDRARWRKPADKVMRRVCKEDGMNFLRRAVVNQGVRWFGEPATHALPEPGRRCAP